MSVLSLSAVTGVKENGGSDQIAADVTPGHRVAHVSGELTFDEAISSSDVTAHSDVNKAMTPLFVHFTFTLKRKAEHHNITVTTLPVCLSESRSTVPITELHHVSTVMVNVDDNRDK